jgi:hypothetical protein
MTIAIAYWHQCEVRDVRYTAAFGGISGSDIVKPT